MVRELILRSQIHAFREEGKREKRKSRPGGSGGRGQTDGSDHSSFQEDVLFDLREGFIECVRDPGNASHMSKEGNATKIVARRGMMIQLERYQRSNNKHLPIFYGSYSSTPFGGVLVKVNEYALYTAARTVISVLV